MCRAGMSASLIGQLGQARIAPLCRSSFTRGHASLRSLAASVERSCCTHAADWSEQPRFWTRFEAQRTSSASAIPSSAWDDPNRDRCGLRSVHAAAFRSQAELGAICRASRTLSAAGRRLFSVSRMTKTSGNDADRLRKYLARFGLKFEDVSAPQPSG